MLAQRLPPDPVQDAASRRTAYPPTKTRNSVARRRQVARRAGEHLADPQRPLDRGGRGLVVPLGGDASTRSPRARSAHAVLAERGQHPLDVCRVGPRGPDDEDAAALVAAPVGIQQVCRPVQRDDRLAGAGATGDLGDPAGRRPDRLVLVALDGGDDVAHLGAAAAGESRHEGAVADDDEVVGRIGHHEVVLDADDDRAPAAQHPPAQHAQGLDGGGPIERRGRWGPPVHDQRLVVLVADTRAGRCSAPRARWPVAGCCGCGPGASAWCSRSSRPKTNPSYWVSSACWRRAAWKTRASRSKSPVISSSRASPVRSVRPRAMPSAATSLARSEALASSVYTRSTCACSTASSSATTWALARELSLVVVTRNLPLRQPEAAVRGGCQPGLRLRPGTYEFRPARYAVRPVGAATAYRRRCAPALRSSRARVPRGPSGSGTGLRADP
jgi:hypothetical protein